MIEDDPVVQRVRETRRAIAARLEFDRHRLLEWAKQIEAAHLDRLVRYDQAPGTPDRGQSSSSS